jgi:adenylylsulfate reductase, subunit B
VRGYADFVPLGASVTPMRSTDSILWTVKFRNGSIKRFKFPTRTTTEGSAVPDGGFAGQGDLKSQNLFTEPASLGLPAVVATLKRS